MPTEREKMLSGELYDPLDPELGRRRDRARDLCQLLNATREGDQDVRLGPSVQIYTATHRMDAALRRKQELGRPVEIGSDVWIGGGALVLPGVHIGARAVIGAGSVVTRDVPADVFAAGNPCRVIRQLPRNA